MILELKKNRNKYFYSSGKTEFILNQFADLTPQEFKSKILMRTQTEPPKIPSDKYDIR